LFGLGSSILSSYQKKFAERKRTQAQVQKTANPAINGRWV
jgi:hypothetical protein